jgi:hypothetical protein
VRVVIGAMVTVVVWFIGSLLACLFAGGPRHRAYDVRRDQGSVGRVPGQHGVRLGQRDHCRHLGE